MFQLLLVACAFLVYAVMAESEEGQTARSRVSDEQLNMALSDQRYLRRQLKCALGEAPCDPVGRRLKSTCSLAYKSIGRRDGRHAQLTTSCLLRNRGFAIVLNETRYSVEFPMDRVDYKKEKKERLSRVVGRERGDWYFLRFNGYVNVGWN